jgi:hypothetical protein
MKSHDRSDEDHISDLVDRAKGAISRLVTQSEKRFKDTKTALFAAAKLAANNYEAAKKAIPRKK